MDVLKNIFGYLALQLLMRHAEHIADRRVDRDEAHLIVLQAVDADSRGNGIYDALKR